MSKRATTEDSADEVEQELLNGTPGRSQGGSEPKRARFSAVEDAQDEAKDEEDEDEDMDQLASPEPESSKQVIAKNNKKGKEAAVEEEDEDAEDEDAADAESDNNEEEDELVSQGAAKMRNRAKGAIAESGVIETVTLKNFMCHSFLEVRLSPQINFIIGHNGSGKSVILTGITFAFGAKASATGRATTLDGFVKKGSTSCEVTVALRNKGAEAFKPNTYGKMIYITRRVALGGTNGYKIAGYEKKTISTKRDELSAICDHFNIQMDNPVNILSQDMAKVFLHSSKPKDKYTFFLKGTQLAQLTEEYNALWEQMNNIAAIVTTKSDRLKELKQAMREAQAAWTEIEKAKNVETEIRKFKNELAWTLVQDVEKKLHEKMDTVGQEEKQVQLYETTIKQHKEALAKIEDRIKEAETAANEEDNEDLDREFNELKTRIKDGTKQISNIKSEQRAMLTNIERLRANIKSLNEQIEGARKLLDGGSREKQERARAGLARVDAQIEQYTDKTTEARAKAAELDAEVREARRDAEMISMNELPAARQALEQAENMIRSIDNQRQNVLAVFGPQTPAIMQAIQRETGWREQPIGPIGRFVKLRDPTYAKLAESFFGETLNGFVVTNNEDRQRLNRLIDGFRGARYPIYKIIREANWDYRGGLPDSNRYTSMLDILSFDDEFIKKSLIDISHIEGSAVVREMAEGDELMRRNDPSVTKVVACFTPNCYRMGGKIGTLSQTAMNIWNKAPRLTRDLEGDTRAAQEQRAQAERTLQGINVRKQALERQLTSAHQSKKQYEQQSAQASGQLRRLQQQREALVEDSREEEPPNVRALEEAKAEAEAEIQTINTQGEGATEQIKAIQERTAPLVHRRDDVEAIRAQREGIRANRQTVLEKAVVERVKQQHAIDQYGGKLKKQKDKVTAINAEVEAIGEGLQEAMDKATEVCPRDRVDLSGGKHRKKYENQIASMEKALRDKERQAGGTSEEIHKKWVIAKADYEDNKASIDDLRQCMKLLRSAHNMRMDRWNTFRSHISMRSRMLFLHNLNIRGYSGDLKFKHEDQKLELRVITSEDGGKSQRTKDSATLSGGEKSYSTICLLLSLWEAAGCPIRGLDEFDVFMDAMNRRISTDLLIGAARASNNTQMILITPNSIANSVGMEDVKVIKIADPIRGQGTLAAE